MFPDVEIPVLSVITQFPGASPETVEREVTKKLEQAVNPISGVKHVYSTSREGLSTVIVEFNLEVKINDAAQDARSKISAIRNDLPAGDPGAGHPEARHRRHGDRLARGALRPDDPARADDARRPEGQAAHREPPRRREGGPRRREPARGRRRPRPVAPRRPRPRRRRGRRRALGREREHAPRPARPGRAGDAGPRLGQAEGGRRLPLDGRREPRRRPGDARRDRRGQGHGRGAAQARPRQRRPGRRDRRLQAEQGEHGRRRRGGDEGDRPSSGASSRPPSRSSSCGTARS